MNSRATAAFGIALAGATATFAQQPAPPAPAFAAPNLEAKGIRSIAATCASCHGTEGRPVAGSAVASLAGRSKEDLVQAMTQFRAGQRPNTTIMHQIAKGYGDAEIAALADYFSKQSR